MSVIDKEENTPNVGQAGTLEANDVLIRVELRETGSGVFIDLNSSVKDQYGEAIRRSLLAVVAEQKASDINITVIDRGALDCTIRARLLTALTQAGAVGKKRYFE